MLHSFERVYPAWIKKDKRNPYNAGYDHANQLLTLHLTTEVLNTQSPRLENLESLPDGKKKEVLIKRAYFDAETNKKLVLHLSNAIDSTELRFVDESLENKREFLRGFENNLVKLEKKFKNNLHIERLQNRLITLKRHVS
ncbi:Uncharacterised protein [uncultured archaeon]|nr:Uncharacterised protein [uncultured archaeon]